MVDFASGLMSFATGVVKGGIEQQKRRDARELGIIETAEEDAATEVGILIEQSRKTLDDNLSVFNTLVIMIAAIIQIVRVTYL